MKINDFNMLELISPYMQDDLTVKGLCAAGDYIIKSLFESINKMDFFTSLELLDESTLDYIAKVNQIIWYKDSDSKSVKVEIIKNSDKVFWNLGTVSAVESLVLDLFGSGEVQEWFEYGGDPYHFKIVTENPEITADAIQEFRYIIEYVKKKSAILDGVEIALSASMYVNYGIKMHTGAFITLEQEG